MILRNHFLKQLQPRLVRICLTPLIDRKWLDLSWCHGYLQPRAQPSFSAKIHEIFIHGIQDFLIVPYYVLLLQLSFYKKQNTSLVIYPKKECKLHKTVVDAANVSIWLLKLIMK